MTPGEIATLENNIVEICKAHEAKNWRKEDYRACVFVEPCYFVKYGDPETLQPEITTQNYIFNYAESQADTSCVPRIPKIEHYFQNERTMYLVMECITLTDPPPDLIKRVAEALKWLSEVKPPPNHVIGPLGSGCIRHKVFKDFEAPLRFPSVDALERYLEAVRPYLYFLERTPFANMESGTGVHDALGPYEETGVSCQDQQRSSDVHAV